MSNSINKALVAQWSVMKDTSIPQPILGAAEEVSVNSASQRKRRSGQSRDAPAKKRLRAAKESQDFAAPQHISLADLGGMESVIADLQEIIVLPLTQPERYIAKGHKIPCGILLHGPPGCGKTMLCEALASELGLPWINIAAPSIVSGMSGESEKQLRQHFENAIKMAPCLMFFDEIDAIAPKREGAQREMERRIVAQFLTSMDSLSLDKTAGKPVIVLAATNRPDSLDPALRRAGRFDIEINIGVPTQAVRERILRAQTRKTQLAPDVDLARLAKMTPGFVGADLGLLIFRASAASNKRYIQALQALSDADTAAEAAALTTPNDNNITETHTDVDMDAEHKQLVTAAPPQPVSAAVSSFRRLKKLLDEGRQLPEGSDDTDTITMIDFLRALPLVQPSATREGFATIPDTTWADVGALHSARQQLHDAIVEPIRRPEVYERFGISVPAGILLWGPPGCGKTLLAKAVANESKANFISIKGPELMNKYVGESERAVRQVFFRARSSVPCVIFFDELDSLVPRRMDSLSEAGARVVNALLTELDGISTRTDIYVIGATNRPEMIDSAILRPGRIGKHIYVGPPAADERVEILRTVMAKMPLSDPNLAEFARANCDEFSGADLAYLASEAAQTAVRRDADVLELSDLETAIKEIKSSVGDLGRYQRFLKKGMSRGFA